MTRYRTLAASTIFGIALLGTACGNGPPAGSGSGSGSSGAAAACPGTAKATGLGTPAVTINETDANAFTPNAANVKVGDVVEFKNGGSAAHNATFDCADITSQTMNGGDTWQVKFTTAGSYNFQCTFHVSLGMTGKVTVS